MILWERKPGKYLYFCTMFWIIGFTAFAASLLTLFSGFGLGTLLTPVFGLFFPIHIAVALTGIVHLLNNLFKVSLLGKAADWAMVKRFGIPSVAGGLLGAWLLSRLTQLPILLHWEWGSLSGNITPLKLCIGLVMVVFTFMELVPVLNKIKAKESFLTAGGLLSGFFGGLSGNQGALRSAFLINSGIGKQGYIATGVVIACLVDFTRLPVYFSRFESSRLTEQWPLLLTAVISAFAGAWIGNKYLKKVTFSTVQWITGSMMLVFALLLASGII